MDHLDQRDKTAKWPTHGVRLRAALRGSALFGVAGGVCLLVACVLLVWYVLQSPSRASEQSPQTPPREERLETPVPPGDNARVPQAAPARSPSPAVRPVARNERVDVERRAEAAEDENSGLDQVRRAIAAAKSSSRLQSAAGDRSGVGDRWAAGVGFGGDPGGVVEIGVAHGTEKRHWLQWAVEEFAGTQDGRRILVDLIPMGSMESAHAILDGDERIHVWAPASKMYLRTFLRDWEAKRRGNPIVKGEDLALTPMVIVMWKPRYDSFLIKAPEVSMKMLGYAMHAKTGWGAIAGKPEWGHFKFGHTHPLQSNSGLMTLVLLAYEFHEKTAGLSVSDVMSQDFQDYLAWFERGVTGLSNSTGNMMREMVYKGPASFDALMVYESVAIDYFKRAEGRWGRLQVVYPNYNVWNDNPYYILDTPWTTEAHQRAAETFLAFLMSEPIQVRALDHGFRPGNPSVPVRGPASPFVRYAEFGLKIDLPAVCEPPSPEVIDNLQQSWVRGARPGSRG
jgi:hypothetical protein